MSDEEDYTIRDSIKIKKMLIYGVKLFYNAFIFFWTFQIVKTLLIFVQYAETTDQQILYSILLIISLIAIRYPLVSLKYYEFE